MPLEHAQKKQGHNGVTSVTAPKSSTVASAADHRIVIQLETNLATAALSPSSAHLDSYAAFVTEASVSLPCPSNH